jgi:predicted AlkP superfamily phosphohydrolase/phosphomutase
LHLMATIEWRLFFPCFILPDRVQHLYYTLLDEKCLEGRPLNNAEDKLRARLTGLYADLDNAIGKIADSLNEDDTLIFVSDHGFGPLKRIFHLNTWLRDRGYLKFKADDVRSWLGRILPESVKRPLRAVVGRRKAGASGAGVLAMVDWDATRAYCGSGAEQGVYINLKGREPFGVVEQGMEYIKVRDALMRELAEAIDPATHEKVFEVVLPREEVQSGRYIEDAADIFIQPRRHEWIMAEEHVEDLSIPWHHQWGGFHREEGIFIASGPSINAGESLPPFDMTQVMPSILAMLALPIPEWVDAAPPGGLFSDEFTSAHPLKRKAYAELLAKYEKDAPTDADDTGGEDLLKGLGYIN